MKVGILGHCGSIGSRHTRNLLGLGHQVVGYDPTTPHGDTRDDVLACDAIVIATPTPQHYADLLDAFKMSKPVFCEKPLVFTYDEWERLFANNGADLRNVMMGNNLRLHECARKAKDWLERNILGNPLWALFQVRGTTDKPAYRRDGVIRSSGAHEVDLALWLLGPARVVAASANDTETVAETVLQHESGCRSTVIMDWVTEPQMRTFAIAGSKSRMMAELAPGRAYYRMGQESALSQIYRADDSFDQNYVEEMANFIDFAQGKPLVGASGVDGLNTLGLLLDIREMAKLP